MWKYLGKGEYVPGVPARDLSDEEYEHYAGLGLLPKGSARAKLYRKDAARPAERKVTTDGPDR